jgi:plastocyanin
MNARSSRKHLLVAVSAFFIFGVSSAAYAADDMGGMKMDPGKKAAQESARGMAKGAAKKRTEKLEIAITENGFEPDKVTVMKGEPVELVFTRKTEQTCAMEVLLDTGSKKIRKALPLNKAVTIKTKFTKTGELKYACKMNMFTGTVTVQ